MKRTMMICAVLACVLVCAWAQDKAAPEGRGKAPAEVLVTGPLGANTNPVRCDMLVNP